MFARHGALIKHQHKMEGINSRLDGLQAAILLAKLPYILEWTDKRIENARYYDSVLSSIPQVVIPVVMPQSKHTYHLYVIRTKNRGALAAFLQTKGIETSVHYPVALPFMEAYEHLNHVPNDFPVSYQYQSEILSLPMYPELTTVQMNYVAESIKDFYAK